jgi:hypothetical protein
MGDVTVEDVLFPDLDGLLVQDVELVGDEVRVVARACATGAEPQRPWWAPIAKSR